MSCARHFANAFWSSCGSVELRRASSTLNDRPILSALDGRSPCATRLRHNEAMAGSACWLSDCEAAGNDAPISRLNSRNSLRRSCKRLCLISDDRGVVWRACRGVGDDTAGGFIPGDAGAGFANIPCKVSRKTSGPTGCVHVLAEDGACGAFRGSLGTDVSRDGLIGGNGSYSAAAMTSNTGLLK